MNAICQDITREARWGVLSAPVDPEETRLCMRAQSILSGPDLGQCPPLDIKKALDVLAWYAPKH